MFLTRAQLVEMTGYKHHDQQAQWLAENGYSFDRRKDGRPNVLVEQVRERQLQKPDKGKPGPDFSWLDQAR